MSASPGRLPPGSPRHLTDRELRIAIYSSNFFNEDGVTLTVRRILSYVKEHGGEVRILTTVPNERAWHTDRTVSADEIIEVPAMDFPMPSYKPPGEEDATEREREGYVVGKMLGQKAMALLNEFDPNIMHITCPDGGALAAISWAGRHNVPCLATWHSNFHTYTQFYPVPSVTTPIVRRWLWFFYLQVPLVLVPTAQLRLELASELGFSPQRMGVWGRGIKADVFTPEKRSASFRAKHGVGDDDVLFCWSSRIVVEKRFDVFAEVVRRLAADGFRVHTLIAGKAVDDLGSRQLKQVRASLPNLHFVGWIEADELAVMYASSDVLLFPSGVETFGNVTLEGMASGLPCIVDITSGSHLVDDGVHGYTVPAGDLEGYYQAARRLCVPDGKALRQRMGQAGRKRAVDLYDSRTNTRAMVNHYKALNAKESRAVYRLSLRWFIIDLFSNVVLALFIAGSFLVRNGIALYLLIAGK